MDAFDELLKIAEKLNGPDGCPWDRTQTFFSLQPYLLEEVHEVIEAVDSKDDEKTIEELGDLFYTVIFYCKVAQKDKKFSIQDVIKAVQAKLIHRHPHVFGDLKFETPQEVMKEWEKRKLVEKGHKDRKSAVDGIPETLPLIARAQKLISKILRKHSAFFSSATQKPETPEEEISQELTQLLCKAHNKGVDLESALRRTIAQHEKEFRAWEKTAVF
ncbi:MAG: MazG family protein [Chlamydiales bacterium]|nr:MazG family protein [Chlamydiales bacterium]